MYYLGYSDGIYAFKSKRMFEWLFMNSYCQVFNSYDTPYEYRKYLTYGTLAEYHDGFYKLISEAPPSYNPSNLDKFPY